MSSTHMYAQPGRPERRSRERAELSGEVRVEVDGRTVVGEARDVSTGGLGMHINEAFDVGAHVTVDFSVPGSGSVQIDAEVAWTDGDRSGVRFVRLDPASMARIIGYTSER